MKKKVKNTDKVYEICEYFPALNMKPPDNNALAFITAIFLYSFIASLQPAQGVSKHYLAFFAAPLRMNGLPQPIPNEREPQGHSIDLTKNPTS
ncbi:MAG: hypothetical protein JW896_01755 [Deltaproteobacteria bacterium]|nr:hypothetical protein [Deltaproteobacteria bacterium]